MLKAVDPKFIDQEFPMGGGHASVTAEVSTLKVDPQLVGFEVSFVDTPGFHETNGWK